jgi:ABC-type branched-subunit amino acid transport system substrate-binding protein
MNKTSRKINNFQRLFRLFGTITLVALSLVSGPFVTGAKAEKFKIGGVVCFTGAFAQLGIGMRNGVELAIKDNGGKILDREVELMWADSEMKAMVGVEKTKKFIADGADLIYGAVSSGTTRAVSEVCLANKKLHLVTISTLPEITRKGHRYIFRTSPHQESEDIQAAEAFNAKKDLKSVYIFCHDYQVARDSAGRAAKWIREAGKKVYGPDPFPLDQTDFSVYIHKVIESKADAVGLWATGAANVNFIKQAAQFGLHKKIWIFGPVLVDSNDVLALKNIGLGMETSVRYSWNYDVPANKVFVEKFRKKYGRVPTAWEGEAYDGMSWFIKVVENTGSMDVDKWVDAFEGSVYKDSLKGTKTMRKCDHQAMQVGLWAKVVKQDKDPNYYLKVVKVFPPDKIYEPCPENPADWPSRRTK